MARSVTQARVCPIHLGEILSLTRAILRELQAPRPLPVFAPNREMEALVRALREDKSTEGRIIGEFKPTPSGGVLGD
jgi:hypothetical protein